MNESLKDHNALISKKVIHSLEKNNMKGFYVETAKEVVPLLKELLKEGESIAFGGSITLQECGVIEEVRKGNYNMLDRFDKNLTKEGLEKLKRQAFDCDTFLTGTNAITVNGLLYNVDGNGNRVSAMIFGPKRVIVVCGINKIVSNLEAAVERVRLVSAPTNCDRVGADTFCSKHGYCMYLDKTMCENSGCVNTICCSTVILSRQRVKDRINVIIVGESLGF
ncbi:MAG: lactate utilization protein [Sphaerochaetaceae bacterium]|nr:lactate utilization protein [Sphaerochaetaceae bacterium]